MSDSHPETLIAAYLAGELDEADADRVRQFIAAAPHRRGVIAGIQAAIRGEDIAVAPQDLDVTTAALMARVRGEWSERLRESVGSARRDGTLPVGRRVFGKTVQWGGFKTQPLRRLTWPSVASVLAIAGITFLGWIGMSYHVKPNSPLVPTQYTTANGQRGTITLADGSTVVLGVASRLTVPADYAAGNHTVHLVGEALFTVVHHDKTPFTVLSGPVTARVLGTSFLVRHYATDNATTIAVRDGKVAVRTIGRRPVLLTAARQVKIGGTGEGSIEAADPAQFSFVTGILTLKDVPFPVAIAELDRWYDVDIRLGDPVLQGRRVTGENASGSPADLQSVLEWTFNVRVVRHGRVLTLFPR